MWRLLLLTCLFQCVVRSQDVDPSGPEGRQRVNTVTTTVITTTFTTTTRTFKTVCAKLVNVTGPCRFRRGRWLEEPEVLVFDEDLHDQIDHLFDPSFVHLVEVTPLPIVLEESDAWDTSTSPAPQIQSSIESRVKRPPEASSPAEQRIYYSQLAQLINFFVAPFLPQSTVTITSTSTRTSIVTQRTTSTNTVFIQGCTPPTFPYSQCPKRK